MLYRIVAAILMICVLGLPALAACEGETTPPPPAETAPATPAPAPETSTPEPEPAPTGQDELKQILAESVLALQNVQSYKARVDMDLATEITGGDYPVQAVMMLTSDSVFDMEAKEFHISMNIVAGEKDQPVQNVTMEFYIVSGWVYMKMVIPMVGEQWMKMPFNEEMAETYDLDMMDKHLALLDSPAGIELTGMETVDGVQCYALKITPDVEAMVEWAQQQRTGDESLGWEEASRIADIIKSLSFHVWIAEDTGFLTRMEIDTVIEATGEQMSPDNPGFDKMTMYINMAMKLYDYNEPVSIILPAAAQSAREMPGMAAPTP